MYCARVMMRVHVTVIEALAVGHERISRLRKHERNIPWRQTPVDQPDPPNHRLGRCSMEGLGMMRNVPSTCLPPADFFAHRLSALRRSNSPGETPQKWPSLR